MAFWGAEVEAGKPLTVKPDKGKLIHLSQASIECKGKKKKKKGESTSLLYVSVDDGNKLVIGTLCQDKFPHISFDLVFDKEFVLSHSLEKETVHFIGYQSPKEDGEEEEEETPKQLEPRNKKRANESAFIEPVSAKKTKLTTTTFQKTDLVKAPSTPPPPRCIPPSTILPPLSSVNVLWDMVSCPFPHSQVKASNVKKNISAALTLGSLNLYDIQAFVYDKDYHGDYKHKLDISEIKVVSLPHQEISSIKSAKRDHADVKMAKTMYSWALDHKLPPAPPILIISSNEELMKEIEILKKNGFHVILAHNEEVSMDMKRSASQCIALKHLLRGIWKIDKIPRIIENITGKGKKRKRKSN